MKISTISMQNAPNSVQFGSAALLTAKSLGNVLEKPGILKVVSNPIRTQDTLQLTLSSQQSKMHAMLQDPTGFFAKHLSNTHVQEYLKETPELVKIAQETGRSISDKIHKEIYPMLEPHNSDINTLSNKYLGALNIKLLGEEPIIVKASILGHDVGKTHESSVTWNQPGKPDKFLQYFIDNHTEMGGKILRSIGLPEELAIFAESHHSKVGVMGQRLHERALTPAAHEKADRLAAAFEAAKGADVYSALRASNDKLRKYREHPLDLFRTYVLTRKEVDERGRLSENVFKAIAEVDFGKKPTLDKVKSALYEDMRAGNFKEEGVKDFIVHVLKKPEAKEASAEEIFDMSARALHKMVNPEASLL